MVFSGKTSTVEAFTDPNLVPASVVAEILNIVIANRPDAAEVRKFLTDHFNAHKTNTPAQQTATLPSFHNDKGEISVALVKGTDGTWRLCNEFAPLSADGASAAAPMRLTMNGFSLVPMGRHHKAPPVRAGGGVADVEWFKPQDILSTPGSSFFPAADGKTDARNRYYLMVKGKPEPLAPEAVPMIEEGVAAMRQQLFPLHGTGQCNCCRNNKSPLQPEANAHYDNVARAHGFTPSKPNTLLALHTESNQQQKNWQDKLTDQRAAAIEAAPTLH